LAEVSGLGRYGVELGDGLEVRMQPPQKPHHLNIAKRLALEPP
jgi:hypothetical protein